MPRSRLPYAALSAVLALGAITSAQSPVALKEVTPVVAVVSTSGKLMPLAAQVSGDWITLPWPTVYGDSPEDDVPPPVPKTIAAIPPEWMAPLTALPLAWRLQIVDGGARDIHLRLPARWDAATFDSVGIRVDYSVPKDENLPENNDAGIAVAGGPETLPVHRLDAASQVWQNIVQAIPADFVKVETIDAKRIGSRTPVPAAASMTRELSHADVNAWEVAAPGRTYLYFEASRLRSQERDGPCADKYVYRGLLQIEAGKTPAPVWMNAALDCDGPPEVMEVIGAFRFTGQVRFVVKYSGDDWQDYVLFDPSDPHAEFRGPH